MGFSLTLLVVAVACGVMGLAATLFRPPSTVRHLEQVFVVGIATLGIGTVVTRLFHPLDFFGIVHLLYLLAVVTLPILLGGWFVLSVVRRQRSPMFTIAGAAAAVIAMCGVWATHIEPNWLQVEQIAVIADVPSKLTIGVLADLQTPNVGLHEWNAVNTLIEQEPDLVAIPGDFFQGHAVELQSNRADFVELLSALVAEADVVAVVSGDSDNETFLRGLTVDAGALYIDNTVQEVTAGGQQVRLAGVPVASSADKLTTIADLGAPSTAFTLLVSHRPDVVYELPSSTDVDLIVSGHTHGGQVTLPIFGPPVTFSDVPRSLAAGGIGTVRGFATYVSSGVGLERFQAPQVRFGARPSVGVIVLQPAS